MVIEKLTEYEIIGTSSVCFHCQQAVEKFLKAFLITNGIDIKKTHNIEYLLSECSDIDKEFANIDPKELSDFGVDACYPGDMYVPNEDETLEYKKFAFSIKDFVENKIDKIFKIKLVKHFFSSCRISNPIKNSSRITNPKGRKNDIFNPCIFINF